jgi:poly(A) polymerase
MRLFMAPRVGEVVQSMGESGLLELILGGVGYTTRLRRLIAIEAQRGVSGDALLRLAALGVAISEDADRLSDRLRLANAESDRLKSGAVARSGLYGIAMAPSFQGLRTLLFDAGREAARDALALAHAESEAPPADRAFAAADQFLTDAPKPRLPIGGADLIARGVAAGRPVGRALRVFQARWIRAGFPKEPQTLTRLLEEAVAESMRVEPSAQEAPEPRSN